MTVSATEWAASESIADEPLTMPPIALATAMPRLVTTATMTVPTLSPLSSGSVLSDSTSDMV